MPEQEHNLNISTDYYSPDQTAAVSVYSSTFIPDIPELGSITTNLFEQLKSQFFNEMLDDKSFNGEASKMIEQWLSIRSLDELKVLGAQAKQHFLYQGITFNVYGDQEGTAAGAIAGGIIGLGQTIGGWISGKDKEKKTKRA